MSLNRKLASIQQIIDIKPADNADSLEIARINNWQCVVQKGIHSVGDNVLFFETDSFLPEHPLFEFLRDSSYKEMEDEHGNKFGGFRIKTIKLRGNVSQGLVLPLNTETVNAFYLSTGFFVDQFPVGQDLTQILSVELYEPPIPDELKGIVYSWPGYLNKTGAERLQNVKLEDVLGKIFYATEKIDGVSTTFWKYENKFHVAMRNWSIEYDPNFYAWKLSKMYNLERLLPDGCAIHGEAIGPGTGNTKYSKDALNFYVFNVYDIKHGEYLDLHDTQSIAKSFGLKCVPLELSLDPVASIPNFTNALFTFKSDADFDRLFNYVTNRPSAINPKVKMEGIVLHPYIRNEYLPFERIKVISKQYELKNG